MRVGCGILNVMTGLSLCICCLPLLLVPLGVAEIISGANLLRDTPRRPSGMSTLCVLEIVAIVFGSFNSLAVGILSLVFLSDIAVRNYLAALSEAPQTAGQV